MLRWSKASKEDSGESAAAAPSGEGSAAALGPLGRSLPELLLSEGRINKDQLSRALAKQQETGAFLGEILIEQGAIDEKSLLSFLTKHCKIPHLSLLDYLIDKNLLDLIPKEVCLKYRLLPIDKLGRNLTVAMVNPLDLAALEVIRQQCPELRIKPILCAHKHFEIVTSRLFRESAGEKVELSASSLGLKMDRSKIPTLDPEPAAPAPEAAPEAPAPAAPPPEVVEETSPEPEVVALESEPEEVWPDAEEVMEEVAEAEAEAEAPAAPAAAERSRNDACISEVFREDEADGEATSSALSAAEQPEDDGGASSLMKEMASVMMDSMRDTYAVLARRMDLFRGLRPEDVARIFACGATVEFEEGATIFAKGAAGDSMYVVLGGDIVIEDEGRELAVLGRGDMFGEMALLSEATRSADAKAQTFASCLELSKDIIHGLDTPQVSNQLLLNVIATLSQRLRAANERQLG